MDQRMWVESRVHAEQVKGKDVFMRGKCLCLRGKGQEEVHVLPHILEALWPMGLVHVRKSKVLIFPQVTGTLLLPAD